MTATIQLLRYLFFLRLAAAYRHWRWARLRRCVSCGCELETDPLLMLRVGQYRLAVLSARTKVERKIETLAAPLVGNVPVHERPRLKSLHSATVFLVAQGRIEKKTANRIGNIYGRASRVVHGQSCPRDRAFEIVKELLEVLERLAAYRGDCQSN